jgi:SAM-dependent methyltransferase
MEEVSNVVVEESMRSWILKFCIFFFFLFACYKFIWKNLNKKNLNHFTEEGFEQREPFTLKQNEEVFDSFYAELHDTLNKPEWTTPFIIENFIQMTQCDPKGTSCLLDIGCGAGFVTNSLHKKGFRIFGVDQSEAMVECAISKYPHLKPFLQISNVNLPMTFEKNIFSHILCLNKTIYSFERKEKQNLLQNIYHWLEPNGYFILHLVDSKNFNRLVPLGRKNPILDQILLDKHADENDLNEDEEIKIRATEIDFLSFDYRASWEPKKGKEEIFVERFRDYQSQNIRQNEVTYYMDDVEDILLLASKCGFILKGKSEFPKDPHEFLFVLERPNFY